ELRYGQLPALEKELASAEAEIERMRERGSFIREEVGEQDIAAIVAKWTGIPVAKMLESEQVKLLNMEQRLHERVVGQDEAIAAVADAVRRARSGLHEPTRPVGSFIFLGPTGVGKTELARALAAFLFDDEQNIVRLDMSEFMEKHAVARLIGAPPGYVGFDEGGYLTEHVRRRPYSVILFDEIEKAHPDVFNILLQILDEGRLTDGKGRTVDMRNTVVIMTSNLGSMHVQELGEEELERAKERVFEELKHTFRPEFLNRVDDIIVFHSLSRKHVGRILELQLQQLRGRLAERQLGLELSDAARDWLVEQGFDASYGARPLKRAIQRELQNPLAKLLLSGAFSAGSKVRVEVDTAGLSFEELV
ncbi:MAG: AAA family ATPase, partial [Myxococcota bacterium]|nr:AAA family ATPase [Myxococcota bacterium]